MTQSLMCSCKAHGVSAHAVAGMIEVLSECIKVLAECVVTHHYSRGTAAVCHIFPTPTNAGCSVLKSGDFACRCLLHLICDLARWSCLPSQKGFAQSCMYLDLTLGEGSCVSSSKLHEHVQAGAWDVDDTGLEYMPNKDVAERIQQKVLKMYIRDSVISTGLLAAFCFWPL